MSIWWDEIREKARGIPDLALEEFEKHLPKKTAGDGLVFRAQGGETVDDEHKRLYYVVSQYFKSFLGAQARQEREEDPEQREMLNADVDFAERKYEAAWRMYIVSLTCYNRLLLPRGKTFKICRGWELCITDEIDSLDPQDETGSPTPSSHQHKVSRDQKRLH